jgi:hypothetical protein
MNRPQTRTQIRKSAGRAFAHRNRMALTIPSVREPEHDETPLSPAEISIGVREGLIAAGSAPARATEGALS